MERSPPRLASEGPLGNGSSAIGQLTRPGRVAGETGRCAVAWGGGTNRLRCAHAPGAVRTTCGDGTGACGNLRCDAGSPCAGAGQGGRGLLEGRGRLGEAGLLEEGACGHAWGPVPPRLPSFSRLMGRMTVCSSFRSPGPALGSTGSPCPAVCVCVEGVGVPATMPWLRLSARERFILLRPNNGGRRWRAG